MNKPHKHAELIKAWADGAVIERLWNDPHYKDQAWLIDKEPSWEEYCEYRIKTETKPDVVVPYYFNKYGSVKNPVTQDANLLVTFDGETGELKSAEVLK